MAGSRSSEIRKFDDESETFLGKFGTEATTQLRIIDDPCSRSSLLNERMGEHQSGSELLE